MACLLKARQAAGDHVQPIRVFGRQTVFVDHPFLRLEGRLARHSDSTDGGDQSGKLGSVVKSPVQLRGPRLDKVVEGTRQKPLGFLRDSGPGMFIEPKAPTAFRNPVIGETAPPGL